LLGNASVLVMLLILGIQLSNVDGDAELRTVGIASIMRLLFALLLAVMTVLAIGFEETTVARIVVLLLATLTGVTAIILVSAFSRDADGLSVGEFVSVAVFLTTIISVVTVTVVVSVL
jgi:predicted permease